MVHYPEYPLVSLQACKKRRWMEVTENEDVNDGEKNECRRKTRLCWAEPSVVVDPVEILQLESFLFEVIITSLSQHQNEM